MYVAVNNCFGGFGLSKLAKYTYMCKKYGKENVFCYISLSDDEWIYEKRSIDDYLKYDEFFILTHNDYGFSFDEREIEYEYFDDSDKSIEFRSDPALIETIRELKEKSYGDFAELKLVNIPKNMKDQVYIDTYDGLETVEEKHKTWR